MSRLSVKDIFYIDFVAFSCEKIRCCGWVSCVFLPAVKGGISCCVSRTLITPHPTQHTAPIRERVYSVNYYISKMVRSVDIHSF